MWKRKSILSSLIALLVFTFLPLHCPALSVNQCFVLLTVQDYKQAIQIGEELVKKNPADFQVHYCLTKAYSETGYFKKALFHAKKLEELAKNIQELTLAYGLLGRINREMGLLEQAITYCYKHLRLARQSGNKEEIVKALIGLALTYMEVGNYETALDLLNHAENLKDGVSLETQISLEHSFGYLGYKMGTLRTRNSFKNALELYEKTGNFHEAGRVMINMGFFYGFIYEAEVKSGSVWIEHVSSNYTAEKYFLEGLKRVQKVGDVYWTYRGYKGLSLLYMNTKRYKEAIYYAILALLTAEKSGLYDIKGGLNQETTLLTNIAIALEMEPNLRSYLEELINHLNLSNTFSDMLKVKLEEIRTSSDFQNALHEHKKIGKIIYTDLFLFLATLGSFFFLLAIIGLTSKTKTRVEFET